ncbi:hypothetical protein F5148DRAFT_1152351 [Russula earlei]|uniref:Uncharacterized protein n=1 Tax=Russula earlei TaxID=71964 RepID=A0ACC0TXP0_9AGAM|nr:hypothetical protein F5148DRAFT_1152351 [Russula earlei]
MNISPFCVPPGYTQLRMLERKDIPEFLATQWMSVKQFGDAGISCRKGPCTREEVGQVHATLGTYKKENDLDDEQLDDLIYSSQPTNGFWRPHRSVYTQLVPCPRGGSSPSFTTFSMRMIPLLKQGSGGAAEDEQLRRAVQKKGNDWVAVAELVQHSPADCSDRFRQHTQYQGIRRRDLLMLHLYGKGAWSSEEEGQLHHTIEELAQEDVMSPHNMDHCNETAATFHNNHWILNASMKEACKFGMTTRGRYIWTDRGMGLAETGILQ